MKLDRLYLESISHLDEETQEILINEAPHTSFSNVPDELRVLAAQLVDLNFESYDLPKEERTKIARAFCANGVSVPNTKYKLRNTRGLTSAIELATGGELVLPVWWKRKLIAANGDQLSWIGKDVRSDQLRGWDLSGMVETKDGWERVKGETQ